MFLFILFELHKPIIVHQMAIEDSLYAQLDSVFCPIIRVSKKISPVFNWISIYFLQGKVCQIKLLGLALILVLPRELVPELLRFLTIFQLLYGIHYLQLQGLLKALVLLKPPPELAGFYVSFSASLLDAFFKNFLFNCISMRLFMFV
jgi:hypothetical protein